MCGRKDLPTCTGEDVLRSNYRPHRVRHVRMPASNQRQGLSAAWRVGLQGFMRDQSPADAAWRVGLQDQSPADAWHPLFLSALVPLDGARVSGPPLSPTYSDQRFLCGSFLCISLTVTKVSIASHLL